MEFMTAEAMQIIRFNLFQFLFLFIFLKTLKNKYLNKISNIFNLKINKNELKIQITNLF